jgi:hypothetical protein
VFKETINSLGGFMKRLCEKWRFIVQLIALLGLILAPFSASAATVTGFSDTLSDSRPTQLADHDIKFEMDASTTIANTEELHIQFNGFTVGAGTLVQADFAVLHDADGVGAYTALTPTTDYTIATVTAGADKTVVIVFTSAGATAIGTDKYIEVTFTNGTNKLPNPAAGSSYTIDIDESTFGDTGQVQVAIIDGVTTTATVTASLSVLVEAVADTETVNGQDLDVTSAADSISFGTLTVNTYKAAAHDITVSTNAAEGYTTSIRQVDGSGMTNILNFSTNNIDGFRGAGGTATNASPLAWAAGTNPTGSSANVNSGWYGYTTEDSVLGVGTPNRFTTPGNYWAPFDTTAYEVMYDNVPVNAQKIRIGHMIETNALQPQGTYTGIIEYICTAIF